jgi:hypothetical protein
MTPRSPIAVFFLPMITFGIYALVWLVKTKEEMNQNGAQIPTAWMLIIPIINLLWLWKYATGVEVVTKKEMSGALGFILLLLLGNIGMAVIQNSFNKLTAPAAA